MKIGPCASVTAQCVACSRVISVTRAGLVHVHGPIGNRCPGSQCLPAASASSSSSSTALPSSVPQSPPSSSLSDITDLPPRPAVKILKRVPRASREVAAKKLATVVGNVVNCNDHGSWVRLSCPMSESTSERRTSEEPGLAANFAGQ